MDLDSTPPVDPSSINVLVVDDEVVIASEIVEFLSFEHIGAVAAQDGPTALHCLNKAEPGSFTVMLTDVRMPGINGLRLASDVRSMASEANAIEVILMTGHGSHKVVQDATRIPAFECMAKPLSLSHLVTTIRRAHAATVMRRMNHRESIEDLVRLLERAEALSRRSPASDRKDRASYPDCLPPGGPDWLRDPLGFVLAREPILPADDAAMTAEERAWYEVVLDRAADEARTLLPAIVPLTEVLLGRRPMTCKTIGLRTVLDGLARRHGAAILPTTTPLHEQILHTQTLHTDEQILSLVLDQVIDDVVRSGPDALPVRIETQVGDGTISLQVASHSMDTRMHHERSQPDCEAGLNQPGPENAPDLGGLGLRIAAAASRLLGGRIERNGNCYGHSTTSLILASVPKPAGFGAY